MPLIPPVPIQDANAAETGRPSTRGVPKVSTPFAAGWMPVPPFAGVAAAVQEVELELRERRVPNGMRPRRTTGCAAVRVPERDALVVAERRAEDRAHGDVVAVRGHRDREAPAGRQRRRAQRGVAVRARSLRRARAAAARAKSVRQPPTSSRLSSPRNENVVPDETLPESRSTCGRPGRRRAVQHRDELREVLARGRTTPAPRRPLRRAGRGAASSGRRRRRARGRGSRRGTSRRSPRGPGLRASDAAARRSAIGPRRPARPSARSVGASRRAASTAAANTISAGTRSRNALVPPLAASCCASTEPRAHPTSTTATAPTAAASSGVNAQPAELHCRSAHGREEQQPRHERHGERAEDPAAGEQRVARRRRPPASPPARRRTPATAPPTTQPTSVPSAASESRFGEREQLDLPAPRAEPRESPPRVGRVAAKRRGCQDRERQQQRSALAAEEQEPACCDTGRAGGTSSAHRSAP